MGEALALAANGLEAEQTRVTDLRDHLIARIEHEIPRVTLNGARKLRLPGNVNFSFDFVEGESLLLLLDMQGCCASSGSACSSAALEPSHVDGDGRGT
jgi:cysteine desulfurase